MNDKDRADHKAVPGTITDGAPSYTLRIRSDDISSKLVRKDVPEDLIHALELMTAWWDHEVILPAGYKNDPDVLEYAAAMAGFRMATRKFVSSRTLDMRAPGTLARMLDAIGIRTKD